MNKKLIAPTLFILVLVWAPASSLWAYWNWEIQTPSFSTRWIITALGQALFYLGGALFIYALYRRYASPRLTLFRSAAVFTLMVFWSLFAAIWGFWSMDRTAFDIFSSAWWFDEIGHMLFGAFLVFSLLIFHQNYSTVYSPLIKALGEKHLMRDILGEVALGAILWEAAELAKDFYSRKNYSAWIMRAQLNSVDTVLDIISAVIFAILALLTYEAARKFYHYLRLHDESDEIREETDNALEILEYFAKKINFRRRSKLAEKN